MHYCLNDNANFVSVTIGNTTNSYKNANITCHTLSFAAVLSVIHLPLNRMDQECEVVLFYFSECGVWAQFSEHKN